MNKKINVGLIGVGRIGKLHAENIVKGLCDYATLKSIADIYYENAEELAEKLNVKNVYKDYDEYIALECLPKPNPDTVAREFIKYIQKV